MRRKVATQVLVHLVVFLSVLAAARAEQPSPESSSTSSATGQQVTAQARAGDPSSARPPKPRHYRFFYMGLGIVTLLGDPDTIYMNCYYGDDGNGKPTGVSSLDRGSECGPGGSGCIGTMNECDCEMGLYSTNCD